MSKYALIPLACAFVAACVSQPNLQKTETPACKGTVLEASASVCGTKNEYDLAAIIWPAYQAEPRWSELGIFDHGTGEWQNVYEAVSKKEGHVQPKEPLWGYGRDDDPVEMSRQIDAALAAGINVFIYDWYWYQGRPFLENAVNEGFLKAPNNERMRFFIMWANHHVTYLWNNKKADKKAEPPLYSAFVSYDEFKKIANRVVNQYFKKPNYYKIDGKPVFSIFRVPVFVEGVGGAQKAKELLEYLDELCKKEGFKGVHVMVISKFPDKLPGGLPNGEPQNEASIAKYLGIDSWTNYNWTQIQKLDKRDYDYSEWADIAIGKFDSQAKLAGIPYFANASLGWDNNARYPMEKYTYITTNATPEAYKNALKKVLDWADKNNPGLPKLIPLNAWNEWTEGAYLMPDKQYGYGYLNATAQALAEHKAEKSSENK